MLKPTLAALALPVALATLAGCAKTDAPVDAAKIAATVKANSDDVVKALNGGDAERAVMHDATDVVGMFHGAPNVVGSAQDLAGTKQTVADPAFRLAVSDETVDVAKAGDMAVYRATYRATVTDPKTRKPATEDGNWVVVYKAQPDGAMKMTLSIVTDTAPPDAKMIAPAAAPAAPAPAPAKK